MYFRLINYSSMLIAGTICLSCVTLYHKCFVNSTNRDATNGAICISGMQCYIHVDAMSLGELPYKYQQKAYNDSTFMVSIDILKERPYKDSIMWVDVFRTLAIEKLSLNYSSMKIEPEIQSNIHTKHQDPCWLTWRYNSIVIPESIDTIRVELQISYKRDDKVTIVDTTVNLFRMMGKKKDIVSF
jgi:hypothetical protein